MIRRPPRSTLFPSTTLSQTIIEQGAGWSFDAPTATDNSGTATITILNTLTNTSTHLNTTLNQTPTSQSADDCSNSSTCSQTVTIVDTTAPVITCSNTNKTVE